MASEKVNGGAPQRKASSSSLIGIAPSTPAAVTGINLSDNMLARKRLDVFRSFDTSGDGLVDFAELQAALAKAGINMTRRELDAALREINVKKEGSLNFNDFSALSDKLLQVAMKTKGKATRIPRFYLSPEQYAQYSQLFQFEAGLEGSITFNQLKDFLTKNNITMPIDRLVVIWQEIDDDKSGFLEEGEFMILLIKALGVKKRKVGPAVSSVKSLIQEGWALGELRKIGYDCRSLREAGFSTSELIDVCSGPDFKRAGVPLKELLAAGWDCSKAREANFSLSDLWSAGASISNIRNAGFNDLPSVVGLRKTYGVDATRMKQGGFTLGELRAAGYSSADLRLAGFSRESLLALDRCRQRMNSRSTRPTVDRQSTVEIRQDAEIQFLAADLEGANDDLIGDMPSIVCDDTDRYK